MECFAEYFSEWWLRIKNDVLLTTSIEKVFSIIRNKFERFIPKDFAKNSLIV